MKNERLKFPILFSLYMAQSIPMSFFSTVVPVIMRQGNYSLESIGLLQLIKLPWIFKFLWAPFIDNYTRSKKQLFSWIIFSELFYAAVIITIGIFDIETDFKLIVIFMLIAFTASATQDIATDIFAIYILKEKERSIGNSIQTSGSFIGSLFGTGVLLIAYYYFGWTGLLHGLALCVLFAIIPLFFYKAKVKIDKPPKQRISFIEIGRFFKNKNLLKQTLFLMFVYSGIMGVITLLKPYLVDLGYDVKQIGFMSGIVGTSTATLMSFVAGVIIRKIGTKLSFYLFLFGALVTAIYFYLLGDTPTLFQLYVGICMLWGSYGMLSVAVYTSAMNAVRKNREGTDFTLQIVITHLSSLIIAVMSGKIGDLLGYKGVFKITIIFALISYLILFFIMPLKKRK